MFFSEFGTDSSSATLDLVIISNNFCKFVCLMQNFSTVDNFKHLFAHSNPNCKWSILTVDMLRAPCMVIFAIYDIIGWAEFIDNKWKIDIFDRVHFCEIFFQEICSVLSSSMNLISSFYMYRSMRRLTDYSRLKAIYIVYSTIAIVTWSFFEIFFTDNQKYA